MSYIKYHICCFQIIKMVEQGRGIIYYGFSITYQSQVMLFMNNPNLFYLHIYLYILELLNYLQNLLSFLSLLVNLYGMDAPGQGKLKIIILQRTKSRWYKKYSADMNSITTNKGKRSQKMSLAALIHLMIRSFSFIMLCILR